MTVFVVPTPIGYRWTTFFQLFMSQEIRRPSPASDAALCRHGMGTFSVAMQSKSHGQIALPHFRAGRINGPDGFYPLAVF
jgi:hypothetical protein